MTLHEVCVIVYVAIAGLIGATWAGIQCGALYSIPGFLGGLLVATFAPTILIGVPAIALQELKARRRRRESRCGSGLDGGELSAGMLVWSIRTCAETETRMRCAYCHQDLAPDVERTPCASCGTVLHADCRAALTTCPTLGCVQANQTPRSLSREKGARTWLRRALWVAAILGLGLFVTFLSGHGRSAEIRLDTGDLRYRWLGVPYSSAPMPEPMRSKILSVTSKSPETNPPEWRTVATFPLPTSNNSHAMCRGFYFKAAAWIDADPEVARLVFADIGEYILATNAQYSLPACSEMLSPFDDLIDHETGKVNPNWRSNASVQAYLKRRGDERGAPSQITRGASGSSTATTR